MDNTSQTVAPHRRFLDYLFAYQRHVRHVFLDVIGLYDISHIAITHVVHHQMVTFSSTPSIEFILFKSDLWRFDATYQPRWYQKCAWSSWPSLYAKSRYDELYYLKQLKHPLPLTLAFAAKSVSGHLIYSMASHKNGPDTQDAFREKRDHFYKIGQYCSRLLLPLFDDAEFANE